MLSHVSPNPSPRQRFTRSVVYAIVLLTVIGMVGAMAGSASGQERQRTPLVVLATTDLSWATIVRGEDEASQDLMRLAASGAPANLVTRTAGTCEADAWLSLGAGARTRAVEPGPDCTWPATWHQAVRSSQAAGYGAVPGALADSLASAGLTTAAVGDGAVLALTSPTREAPHAADSLDELKGLADLTVVDATRHGAAAAAQTLSSDLRALAASDQPARLVVVSLTSADGEPQALLLPSGSHGHPGRSTGLVTSPSTHQAGLVQLTDLAPTLLAALGASAPTSMTGQALTLPDGATSLEPLGPTARPAPEAPASVRELVDGALRAKASQRTTLPASVTIIAAAAVLVVLAARSLRGPAGRRHLHGVGVAATVVGALPLGAWLGMVVPWWRLGADGDTPGRAAVPAALLTMTLTAMVAVAFLHGLGSIVISVRDRLLAARPRPPRVPREPGHGPGPLGVHGLRLPPSSRVPTPLFLTAFVLTAGVAVLILSDGATGVRLGFNGMLGMDAVVAGRFYGMSNTAFALAAAALVIAVAAGVSPFVEAQPTHRLRRTAAYLGVGVPGVVALALDGLPQAGADVGGVIALAAALAALTASLVGGRISWKRWLSIGVGALAAAGLFGLVDRSLGSHTHMGHFIDQLQDGTASTTILRKLTALVAPFLSSRAAVLALVVGVVAACAAGWWLRQEVVAWRQGTSGYANLLLPEPQSGRQTLEAHESRTDTDGEVAAGEIPRWLTPALKGLGTLIVVEVLVNDSGLSMACLSLACAAPLLLALVTAELQARVR